MMPVKIRDSKFEIQNSPLYGLVLAGGRSARMGREKAELRYHGSMQSEHCLSLLASICEQAFVSCRKEQSEQPAFLGLPQIHDRFGGAGPMDGILSAMETYPHAAWLVLGCDLPFVGRRIIEHLVRKRGAGRKATAFRRTDDGLPEPMCAIYEPAIFPVIKCLMEEGRASPRRALAESDALLIDPEAGSLIHVNSPGERENAGWLLNR